MEEATQSATVGPTNPHRWSRGRAAGMYLLLLVVFAVPFAVVSGLLTISWPTAVLSGAFFGLFMSGLFGSVALYARRNDGAGVPSQTGRITLHCGVSDVESRALAALHGIRAADGRVVQPGVVVGRTKVSWRSWGEKVRIEAEATNKGSEVTITSRPAVRSTIVDYGKGRRNVASIVRDLNSAGRDAG